MRGTHMEIIAGGSDGGDARLSIPGRAIRTDLMAAVDARPPVEGERKRAGRLFDGHACLSVPLRARRAGGVVVGAVGYLAGGHCGGLDEEAV